MGGRFWLLLAGFLTSSLGTWIYRLALPLLVYDLTGSALGTGLVYVVEYLPYLALSLVGGVLADRFDRRRLLVAGDAVSAVVTLALALLVTAGAGSVWPIYLVALLLAAVDPLYQPAFRAILPSLVPQDRLPQANARVHMGEHAVNMAGPMIGGALVVAFGHEVAVYVDAASFAVSALLIALIGTTPVRTGGRGAARRWRGSVLADAGEGLRFLLGGDRVVLTTALGSLACNFGVWLLLGNLVYYLSAYHGFTPEEIGVVYAFQGAGAVLGAALGSRLVRRWRPMPLVCWATAAGGLSMLLMVVARGPVAIGLAWLGQFAAAGTSIVAVATVRQLLIPERLLGRVLGTSRMIAFSSIPLAALTAGALEGLTRTSYGLMAFAGVSWLAVAAALAVSPLRRVTLADLAGRPPAGQDAAGSGPRAESPRPDPR
uniref:MFS transporter n=1 Tax=Nonomuraea pusilla TaxID=46177 RepID=UPI0006E40F68|nr:MFS transporter [Nonomuraea pusilla]